jgi:hypothetical protein
MVAIVNIGGGAMEGPLAIEFFMHANPVTRIMTTAMLMSFFIFS